MQITFGNKIPISRAQIYDKKAQDFKEATLYELDGRNILILMKLPVTPGRGSISF